RQQRLQAQAQAQAQQQLLQQRPPPSTFIIDNGAYTMKAGYAAPMTDERTVGDILAAACVTVPNALARTRDKQVFTGLELDTLVADWNEAVFRRPVEKGYIVNWEAQRDIWEHSFFDAQAATRPELRVADPRATTLVLTEAPNALPALQKNADEVIMEEWQFGGYVRGLAPVFAAWNDVPAIFGDPVTTTCTTGRDGDSSGAMPADCAMVVDCGYSHTTVTPVYRGRAIQRGIRRLDVGGKFLTNHLKELVSLRQYNMQDETYIVNQVREAACFVSQDFARDLERAHKGGGGGRYDPSVVVEYVLPDPLANKGGFVRPHQPSKGRGKSGATSTATTDITPTAEDVLVLGNERFVVPETLFTPTDIGMKSAGLPEMVMQSLATLPEALHPALLGNILVVGGTALTPGLVERLESEVRRLAPAEMAVRVRRAGNSRGHGDGTDQVKAVWAGANRMVSNAEALREVAVTREQYQEYGQAWAARRFQRSG
ncbi:Actin- protein 6, partial [Ascosphaera acerosa]